MARRTSVKAPAIALFVLPVLLGAAPLTVKVQIGRHPNGAPPRIVELPLESYVAAVLASESGTFRSDEALKAMAVAARTYAVRMRGRHRADGFDLCDTTHCQRVDLNSVSPRFQAAAAATGGELLWYDGKPAFTPYSRDCGGRTEEAGVVWPDLAEPYLKTHDDPWCARHPVSHWQRSLGESQIQNALRQSGLRAPGKLERISVLSTTPSGRAATLLLSGPDGSLKLSATSFRFAMGREDGWNTIHSDAYSVHAGNGGFYFEGEGSGHGVGLCQLGTERMGEAGKSYRDILAFYYPGTTLGLNAGGIRWQRLSGANVSFLTARPDTDRIGMDVAERLIRTLSARTGWPVPPGIGISIYPDLDSFRNATGEPGWVAARTDGRQIHLQPVGPLARRGQLEQTLSHELLHVLMEAEAAPGLPVWFREGTIGFLDKQPVTGIARIPAEADLRQRTDAARARRAYADAEAMVAQLVRTYGETAVLGWVKRGLPAAVTNASTSQPQPNNR